MRNEKWLFKSDGVRVNVIAQKGVELPAVEAVIGMNTAIFRGVSKW